MAKKIATYVIVAALGAGLLATTQAISQEGQQPPTPDLGQMMEMYAKLNAPGPAGPARWNCSSADDTWSSTFAARSWTIPSRAWP
jgi:hypothetical protein